VSRARSALITGLTGQDGSFLAELLLEEGYQVTGMVRGAPQRSLGSSEHLRERVALVSGDLLQPATLRAALEQVRPHEVYHLAGPAFVPESWERPAETLSAITGSAVAILETARVLDQGMRVFLSSSGAMFGDTAWSIFPDKTRYFDPSTKPYMINYRVRDLDAMLDQLRRAGATVDAKIDETDYGRFGWAIDPEGNRIELWEPKP